MKIILGILAALIIAVLLFTDYKWRQWMANHHPTDEDQSVVTPPARRRDRQ